MNKNINDVRGFRARGMHVGIRSKRRDLAMIVSDIPASAAAVFTQNQFAAAPVQLSRKHVADGRAQAIVVNSGNANACTGDQGDRDAMAMAKTMAEALNIPVEDVIVASTGVIGEPLPIDKIVKGIDFYARDLTKRRVHATMAASAILTTDTYPKDYFANFSVDGLRINLAGIAKGSGMIHPNMATMLAFLVSDIDIEASLLDETLREVVNKSFNMISVDGDTSTNDMVCVLCNGRAGNKPIMKKNRAYLVFRRQLEKACTTLAKAIVSDGEGATKFVEYRVNGAKTEEEARRVARFVSTSALVKTALFGRDPNWGRILAAIGNSGVAVDPGRVDLHIGSRRSIMPVAAKGGWAGCDLKKLRQMMRSSKIRIVMDLNLGDASAVAWGTDMSYEYVRINAMYRT
ncbi:MAG: bifunctional glutamate N-acetyltransferase/amino-acid acetyltransferase ArgJ [Acidobacteriota bacterium]|jgi:glutamate N-acetyltransferase / amino-acid N-acetyltransferase